MRTRGAGQRSRLGAVLIERGLINEQGLQRALAMQGELGQRLGTNLLELGLIAESDLLQTLGALRHSQVVSAEELHGVPAEIIRLVPPKLARRYQIVPVKRAGGTLLIGSLNPGEALIEDEIGSLTSRLTRTVMGLEARIHEALDRYYHVPAPVRLKALVQRLERGSREIVVPPELVVAPEATSAASLAADSASPSAEPAAEKTQHQPQPPPRPMFIELPEAERALIYGKRRREALGIESATGTETTGTETTAKSPLASDGAADAPAQRRASTLADVSVALQRVEIRDEIADQVLAFGQTYFRRCLLLMRRKERILGWRGEGQGISSQMVRALDIPVDEASVFKSLLAGLEVWRGPLPPFRAHDTLVAGLGGAPAACIVLPIRLRQRVVSFFYGDNAGGPIDAAPIDELQRLVQKAGVALEVIILKNKIRIL